jgi:hypothetical protein
MKTQWFVKVTDNGKPFLFEKFETRGKASAYAMRWNRGANLRYHAELVPVAEGGR